MADLFFNSFHSATTLVPFEVTMMIMHIVASDSQGSLLGSPGQPLREVSSVSTVLRAAYKQMQMQIRYRARNGIFTLLSREHHRLHPNSTTPIIGQTLEFIHLRALARFFTVGPGRQDLHENRLNREWLAGITFIDVNFRDTNCRWEPQRVEFAYEAFELLGAAVNSGRLQALTLQLHVCFGNHKVLDVDGPGMWNLLKLSGLQSLDLKGLVSREMRAILQERVTGRVTTLGKWEPTGLENPGPGDWVEKVVKEKKEGGG